MELSNWMQERSPRSKGNKYKKKILCWTSRSLCIEQALETLSSGGRLCDLWLSAPETENTLSRKVSFPSVHSLVMWPEFCLVNLSCSHKVRASRVFSAAPTKAAAWGRCRMLLHLLQLLGSPKVLQRHQSCRAGGQVVFVCLCSLRAVTASLHSWFLNDRPWAPHLQHRAVLLYKKGHEWEKLRHAVVQCLGMQGLVKEEIIDPNFPILIYFCDSYVLVHAGINPRQQNIHFDGNLLSWLFRNVGTETIWDLILGCVSLTALKMRLLGL